jgi:hypothetical protein
MLEMTQDLKAEAERRLAGALAASGLDDGRPAYRRRLRALRESNPAAFEEALRHYDAVVVPALCGDADPVSTWIEYGVWLGGLTGEGRLVSIDASGRASPFHGRYPPGALVLHMPSDSAEEIIPVAVPAAPTAAQQATVWLLIEKRLALA